MSKGALDDVLMWLAAHGPATKKATEMRVAAEFDHAQKVVRAAYEIGILNGQILKATGKHGSHELSVPINEMSSSAARHSSAQLGNDLPASSAARYIAAELEPPQTGDMEAL